MTDDRYKALSDDDPNHPILNLTSQEIMEGWHWCMDWDQMLVGPGMDGELAHCSCFEPGDHRHDMTRAARARRVAEMEAQGYDATWMREGLDKPAHLDYTDILPPNPAPTSHPT